MHAHLPGFIQFYLFVIIILFYLVICIIIHPVLLSILAPLNGRFFYIYGTL